jgi:predicted nuclease with TOPRIM domain
MAKSEKALTHKTLARELETLVKRYSEVEDETVSEACNILTQVREPLSLSPAYFLPVVDFFTGDEDRDGLEDFLANRLK